METCIFYYTSLDHQLHYFPRGPLAFSDQANLETMTLENYQENSITMGVIPRSSLRSDWLLQWKSVISEQLQLIPRQLAAG
jgi:hypothetical protein